MILSIDILAVIKHNKQGDSFTINPYPYEDQLTELIHTFHFADDL
jgi:hypothetical protein